VRDAILLRSCVWLRDAGAQREADSAKLTAGSGKLEAGSWKRNTDSGKLATGNWQLTVDGVLVIDKPAGPTSHDVVARVRRALRTRRIGHTGTLDPLATGVLPLVIGRATRLAALLSGADKEYEAGVRLGRATETYDAAHVVGPPPDAPDDVDGAEIERALDEFRGTFEQRPPAYSAKKIGGVAAYKLARQQTPVLPRPVQVTVHALAMESYTAGLVQLRVCASAGFYVRSLAHDLGVRLGCGAYLESLRRTQAGAFKAASAVPLADIENDGEAAVRHVMRMELLLPELPRVVLNERGVRRAAHGNDLGPEDWTSNHGGSERSAGQYWRLMHSDGGLLGLAEPRPGGLLHPAIVLM
jgi:tRNA pseudouridine55 synthase